MTHDFPWFAFYPRDFRDGTTRLTLAQIGALISLLSEEWINGPLPDNADILARLLGMDRKSFLREIWPGLRGHFVADAEGNLVNRRLENEREKSADKSQKRREAAGKRWRKAKTKEEQNDCITDAIASAEAEHSTQFTEVPSSLRSDDATARRHSPPVIDEKPPPDQRQILFRTGLDNVSRLTGKPPPQCRPVIGRWLKACKDEAHLVNKVIAEAVEQRPADPIAWITASLRHRIPPLIQASVARFGLDEVDLDAPLRVYHEQCRREQACLH
ncbi:hypothetical protein CGLAMM_07340 [Acetobacteraceae bacterium EV16G]|uniref:DUF1376 domain-containing protein n=1 Tax=Sorlinia euscelidii TaxID=3081148 RepID=A0ABU7U321_9PROT